MESTTEISSKWEGKTPASVMKAGGGGSGYAQGEACGRGGPVREGRPSADTAEMETTRVCLGAEIVIRK